MRYSPQLSVMSWDGFLPFIKFVNVNLLRPERNNMSGSSVWIRSRTVLVKASVSFPTVAAFVVLLGILFHNAPALADDGCPAPSFAAADEFTVGLVPTSLVTAE